MAVHSGVPLHPNAHDQDVQRHIFKMDALPDAEQGVRQASGSGSGARTFIARVTTSWSLMTCHVSGTIS